MNPTEQASHRTKTGELGNRLDNLETVVDELGRYTADVSKWAPVVTKRLELHSTTLKALTANVAAQREYVDGLDQYARLLRPRSNTLWGRLRWLLTGA